MEAEEFVKTALEQIRHETAELEKVRANVSDRQKELAKRELEKARLDADVLRLKSEWDYWSKRVQDVKSLHEKISKIKARRRT